jgi:hypothetical protein
VTGYASAGGFAMPCAPEEPETCPGCGDPDCDFDCDGDYDADPEHPPELTMDERPFAPADTAQ